MSENAELPDATLIERIRTGDAEAFGVLFDRYADAVRARVHAWLPGNVRRRHSVADVLQEARILAWERFAEFEDRGAGSFRNWLLRIAQLKTRAAVKHHARAAKRAAWRERSRGARKDTAAFAAQGPTPSEVAVAAELESLARKAMAMLQENDREVLLLVQRESLTLRQAAERMGRSYEATKKLHARALYKFTGLFRGFTERGP
jgi:RNA polymerase sigma-70 factor (ECF subfamily)